MAWPVSVTHGAGWAAYSSRWVSLVAGVYLMILSGSVYMFAVYSSNLKQIFHYSTEEINLVATLGNAGLWAGVLGGLWLDFFGPRSTCVLGGAMSFSGYMLMYLAASDYFSTNNIVIGLFAAIMGQGGSWLYGVALKINIKNFKPEDRGKVVGGLVCFFGLSSGVLTQLYKGFYMPNVLNFLLFLAIFLGVGGLVIGLLVNVVPTPFGPQEADKMGRITFIYVVGILLALFNGASSIATGMTDVDPLPFTITMLCLLGSFLVVPAFTGPLFYVQRPAPVGSINAGLVNSEHEPDAAELSLESDDSPDTEDQNAQTEELTPLQAMMKLDFWLLFFVFMIIIGSGITLVNNFAELVFSLADVDQKVVYYQDQVPDYKAINTLVSLFSSFNTLGRMLVGFLSDGVTVRWGKTGRVAFLVAAAGLMCVVQLYFAFAVYVPMLYPGVVFLGVAYGATFCIVPTLTIEFFGYKYFASTSGFLGLAPAVGSELLATLLAGNLNDYFRRDGQFVTIDKSGNKVTHCSNDECYRYTLFITAFLCAVAVLVSLWLWARRRHASSQAKKHAYERYSEHDDNMLDDAATH